MREQIVDRPTVDGGAKWFVVVNPISGSGKGLDDFPLISKLLRDNNIKCEAVFTEHKHHATELTVWAINEGFRHIIVVGGDGTLHEVLNGLVDPTACHLGLIPSGTGNDFAEHIGLSLDAEKATNLILSTQPKDTDFLDVGGRRCMNVTGFGIDVDVLERCQRGKFKGKMKYLLSLVQGLFKFKGCKIEVQSGDYVKTHNALIATACNGSQFGGGIKICPCAESDDKKLNAVIVDFIDGKLKIIKAFIQLMKGKILEYPATTHFLCDRLRAIPETPCTVQLDGELYKDVIFDVQIKSGLKFYR